MESGYETLHWGSGYETIEWSLDETLHRESGYETVEWEYGNLGMTTRNGSLGMRPWNGVWVSLGMSIPCSQGMRLGTAECQRRVMLT